MAISRDHAEVILALMALGFSYQEAASLSAEDAAAFFDAAARSRPKRELINRVQAELHEGARLRSHRFTLSACGPTDGVGRVAFEN